MHKISLWITGLFACLCLSVCGYAQGGASFATFFVTITDPGYEPTVQIAHGGNGVTVNFSDATLDGIAANYTFRQFHRAFPNTQNTTLMDVFIVEVNSIHFMYELIEYDETYFTDAHQANFVKYYIDITDTNFIPSFQVNNYVSTVTFTQPDLNDIAADYSFTAFHLAFPNSTDPLHANRFFISVHSADFIQDLLNYPGGLFAMAEEYKPVKFKISITNEEYLPTLAMGFDGQLLLSFQQSNLQSVFNRYTVTGFKQFYPESYFKDMREVYFIESNSLDLLSDLMTYSSQIFPDGGIQPDIEPMLTPNEYNGQYLTTFATQNRHHNYLELINARAAWDITTDWGEDNDTVRVGVSDWYVHTKHREIKQYGQPGSKIREQGWNSPNYIYTGKENHGTAITGILAGATNNSLGLASIGYNSRVGIRPHDSAEHAQANLIMFANERYRAVNCSWVYPWCKLATDNQNHNTFHSIVYKDEEFYNEMYERGMSMVFAAGNGGDSVLNPGTCNYTSFIFPASYDHNISVTSVGSDLDVAYVDTVMPPPSPGYHRSIKDVHDHVIYDTSGKVLPGDYGRPHTHHNNTRVDICAPGYTVHVLDYDHTKPNDTNLYMANAAGTSTAAPLVTGTIGLLLSQAPCLTPFQVEWILKTTAEDSIYTISHNLKYANPKQLGAGRLDAGEAVERALFYEDCNNLPAEAQTMYIEEIKIDHRCWHSTPATLTPVIRNGNGDYKYRWKAISNNNVTISNEYVANPTVSGSGNILYFLLTVTEQNTPIPRVAKKRIRVESKSSGWDLAIRDGYGDKYNEPNDMMDVDFRDWNIWNSPDIWNNTYSTGPEHENPDYSTTNDNQLRIRIRNVGCQASPNTAILKTYWTIASTGEKWPGDWTTNMMMGTIDSVPTGLEINPGSTLYIPTLQVGEDTTLTISWNPPDPADYTTNPDKLVPLCILARVLNNSTSPHGLNEKTHPDTAHLKYNILQNNNIATRNMMLVDYNFIVRSHTFTPFIANAQPNAGVFSLQFMTYRDVNRHMSGNLSAYMYGVIHLGALYDIWMNGGAMGNAVILDSTAKTVLYDPSVPLRLDNLLLSTDAMIPIDVELKLRDGIDVPQRIENAEIYMRQTQTIVYDDGEDFEEVEDVLGGIIFSVTIDTMTDSQNKPGRPASAPILESSEKYVKVYPNPAKDYVIFEYTAPENSAMLTLSISNIAGQEIQTISLPNRNKGYTRWTTGDNPPGVYIYKLYSGHTSIDVGRVVITK